MNNPSHTFTYFVNNMYGYWTARQMDSSYSTKAIFPLSLRVEQQNQYQDFIDARRVYANSASVPQELPPETEMRENQELEIQNQARGTRLHSAERLTNQSSEFRSSYKELACLGRYLKFALEVS